MPTDRAEIQRLLTRLADGDRDAFPPAFAQLWPLVRGFVAKRLPPEDAEDVAQQALLNVFARASELDPERDALAWCLGIAAWETRTAWKKRARRRESGEAPLAVLADGGATPEDALVRRDLESALGCEIASLAPEDAETLLAAIGERARPEGVAPATFRKRASRAMERLRAAWRTRHGVD